MVGNIANPGANMYIVRPIIVQIMIRLFPYRIANSSEPRLTSVVRIPHPLRVPWRFICMTGIRIMIIRLVVTIQVATSMSIAMLKYAPFLSKAYRVRNKVLYQVKRNIKRFNSLAYHMYIRVNPNAIVPSRGVTNVNNSPTARKRSPTCNAI